MIKVILFIITILSEVVKKGGWEDLGVLVCYKVSRS